MQYGNFFSQVYGSFYDEKAPGNGWKCRKCLKQATACLGCDRGFLVVTKFFSVGLGADKGFLGRNRASWLNVATWFSLCRDMVLGFKL